MCTRAPSCAGAIFFARPIHAKQLPKSVPDYESAGAAWVSLQVLSSPILCIAVCCSLLQSGTVCCSLLQSDYESAGAAWVSLIRCFVPFKVFCLF